MEKETFILHAAIVLHKKLTQVSKIRRMAELMLTLQKRMMKVVVGMLAVLSVVVGQTCFEGPGGASMTETKAGGHNIQVVDDLPDLFTN